MTINADIASSSISQKIDAPQYAAGKITFDSSISSATEYALVTLGFTPRYIIWNNVSSGIKGEWYEGMAANTSIKCVAAGNRTLETTNGGFTVCDEDGTANTSGKSFKVIQNATLLLIAASDVVYWNAFG